MTFENILSRSAIIKAMETKYSSLDYDTLYLCNTEDTSKSIAKFVYECDGTKDFDTLDEEKKKQKISAIKRWLNKEVPTYMDADEIISNDTDKILVKILKKVTECI